MTEQEWIKFGLLNNNMLFIQREEKAKNGVKFILSEEQSLKIAKKNKETITKFMRKNIECFNYLYKNGFILIDDYYRDITSIKRLMKKFNDYILYIDVEVDFRANGVCYLNISVNKNNKSSYGYIFDKPTIKQLDWVLNDIKAKDNECYSVNN